jgi:hypothetical protein
VLPGARRGDARAEILIRKIVKEHSATIEGWRELRNLLAQHRSIDYARRVATDFVEKAKKALTTSPIARTVPFAFHLIAAAWIVGMLVYAKGWPAQYEMLVQEDRYVEWATVWLFLAAGVIGMRRAIAGRRWFDALVALFCLFFAGEEMSWGQRLLGYAAPQFFLSQNYQQEVNVHDLTESFLQPKWILMVVLAAYGLFLPLVRSRVRRIRELMEQIGATAPPRELMVWFAAGIALLYVYPVTLTGEWVEVFAGALFLMSMRPRAAIAWTNLVAGAVFGIIMTIGTDAIAAAERDPVRIACARAEVRSLLDDIASGGAATPQLWRGGDIHRRVWSIGQDQQIRVADLTRFTTVLCSGPSGEDAVMRHQYGIDPWGSPYWVHIQPIAGNAAERRVIIYSFGPNRRRDFNGRDSSGRDGDDVLVARTATLPNIRK